MAITHDVVVRHDPFGAIVGQGHDAAAIGHQGHRALGHGGQGVAGDVQRAQEVVAAGVDVLALQFFLVGIGDGVNQKVDGAPLFLDRGKHGLSIVASSVTSQCSTMVEPTDAARGSTRRFKASPW